MRAVSGTLQTLHSDILRFKTFQSKIQFRNEPSPDADKGLQSFRKPESMSGAKGTALNRSEKLTVTCLGLERLRIKDQLLARTHGKFS